MQYFLTIAKEGGSELVLETRADAEMVIRVLSLVLGGQTSAADDHEQEMQDAAPKKGKKGRKQKTCSLCGRPHRRDTCGENGEAKAEPVKQGTRPLSEDEFDFIRYEVEHGEMNSKEYARDNELPLREVNLAVFSKSYEEYLSAR